MVPTHRVLSTVLCTLLCVALTAAGADEGLLLRLPLDEGTGTLVRDSSGTAVSGRLHQVEWTTWGNRKAPRFGRSDSYIEIGGEAREALGDDLTITAWVMLKAMPFPDPATNWVIMECEDYAGKPLPQSGFTLRIAGESARPYFRSSQAGSYQDATLPWAVTNRRPYLIGVVKRGATARLFLNGLMGPEFQLRNPAPGPAPLRLGGAGQSCSGMIGEVRIYRRALPEEELGDLYRRTAAAWAQHDPSTEPGPDADLALTVNGCWAVPSSNANWADLYVDNLIDGDPETAWQSFQPTREEYVELRWDFAMAIHRVVVLERAEYRAAEMELLAWIGDQWRSVARQAGAAEAGPERPVEFRFPALHSQRLRLVCRNAEPRRTSLREVEVYGPTQPLLYVDNGPDWRVGRWTYFPTARREQVESCYRAAAAGKPGSPYEGVEETLTLEAAEVAPQEPRPGQDVTLALRLRPAARLTDDYTLVATVGEREALFQFADYTVARAVLTPATPPTRWAAGEEVTVETIVHLPVWAPDGASSIMIHAISPGGHPPLRLLDPQGRELKDGVASVVQIRRFAEPPKPDPRPHRLAVDTANGTVLTLDGRRIVPTIIPILNPSYERFHYYTQGEGVRILGLQCYPWAINAGSYQQRNFEYLAQHVRNALRVAPDAYLAVLLDLRTRPDWQEAHPEGCLTTYDGRRKAESFCAREYRDEALSYVSNLVTFVQGQPWGNRVLAYSLQTGAEGVMSGGTDIGDYNRQAIEAFRGFVRARYGNDPARLRRAYNDPQLTFETVFPKHEEIMAPGFAGGCFLDPKTQRLTSDYYEFLSSLVPTFTEELGATIKRLTEGRALVGAYGAYLLEAIGVSADLHQANHCYTSYLMQAPDLDFYSSPHNYHDFVRQAGGPYRPYHAFADMRLHGKLHLSECDVRTFRCGMRNGYTHRSREETISVLTRDLGTGLIHGMWSWLADWSEQEYRDRSMWEPFFVDEQILAHVATLRQRYEETLELRRGLDAEVAVFLSGPAAWHMDNGIENNAHAVTNCLSQVIYALMKTGVPYHELTLEDVVRPDVQAGYRCYVFLNSFYLTQAQAEAVEALKRDGKTLVWLYAPGYVRDEGLAAENVGQVTGFSVGIDPSPARLAYRLADRGHPLTLGLDDMEYQGDPRPVAPRFHVTSPEATVLGRYADGKAALVAHDFGTFKSVYSCVPVLPLALLRNVLRYAGCHAYVTDGIYVDATRNFLLLTNTFAGKREVAVSLPGRSDVSDLLTGAPVAAAATQFGLLLAPGETRLLRLK